MIIVDTALERREAAGDPVRVALVGAGYMGRGAALQILTGVPGMRLVAVSNRTLSEAERAYTDAGAPPPRRVATAAALEEAIARGRHAVTDDAMLLCEAEGIDVVIEATGDVELGARVAMRAIEHGRHVVLMNAEVDATVGPILKVYADRAGVVITNADGDQPGVLMNLLRWVRSIGCRPVLAGNVKGLQDPYRTPETQARFAAENGQKPRMVTSFADGTKIGMEMAVVANATGFRVATRGMRGPRCAHVNEAPGLFPLDELLERGQVDYVLGAEPGPGVFVLGHDDHPARRPYMRYFKMGEGPLYVFYVPYHLPHLEVPLTAARAALFQDAAIAPAGRPRGGGGDAGQARPAPRRGAGRHRRVHLLRQHRLGRGGPARRPAADGAGRGVHAAARRAARPSADARRRGAPPRPPLRPAAGGAGRALRPSPAVPA
jgi:predicted homoserine dehydrogenase-like protein